MLDISIQQDYCMFMQKTSPLLFNIKRRKAVEARSIRMAHDDADFLVKIAATIMADRLNATNRDFAKAVDMFSLFNTMSEQLNHLDKVGSVLKVGNTIQHQDIENADTIIGSPEAIPLKANSINLVTSIFGLHRSNDLPGTLKQIETILIEDGLFLAALPGDRTLMELRESMLVAESELNGNATLRIDPFGEVRQFGSLLQRAGFALPVVDTEVLTVRYPNLKKLISDMRAMGTTSCVDSNRNFGPRELFTRTEEIYRKRYQDKDGKIRATFEIVFLSGWSPHASQQKPLKRGSAKNRLSDFLNSD